MPPAAKFAVRIGLRWDSRGIEIVAFGDAKDDVPVAVAAVAEAGKDPAEDQVLARWTFADHERVTGAVGDIRQPHTDRTHAGCVLHRNENAAHSRGPSRRRVNFVVLGGEIAGVARIGMPAAVADTGDALVGGEGDGEPAAKLCNFRDDERPFVGRATGKQLLGAEADEPRFPGVEAPRIVPGRRGNIGIIFLLIHLIIHVALFDPRHDAGEPAHHPVLLSYFAAVVGEERHVIQAGRERAQLVVISVQGDTHLFQVIGTFQAVGGFAHFLDGGQ